MARVVRIAFPTVNGGLDDTLADRFGRAPSFTIVDVDLDTGQVVNVKVVQNPGAMGGGGAGPRAAQLLASEGVQVYAGPSPGPNAYAALQALGIKVYTITGVSVREALQHVIRELRGSG